MSPILCLNTQKPFFLNLLNISAIVKLLPNMLAETEFDLQIKSKPENVGMVEPFIDTIRQRFRLLDDLYFNMLVVLTEAVNNSIIHGNQADPYKNVRVQCRPNGQRLKFTITDEGKGFNPERLPDPTSPERLTQPNGRGVFLMRQLSDTVEYFDHGRRVEIQFRMEQQRGAVMANR